jgi:DNA-binding transcriptional ArsR family regulator
MLSVADEDRLDLLFAALANRRRRAIVLSLATHPASIAQLAQEQGMSLPAIHRHIVALEGADLVHRRKSGRVNYLAISRSGLALSLDWLGGFHPHWGTDQESLENYIAAIERSTARTPSTASTSTINEETPT